MKHLLLAFCLMFLAEASLSQQWVNVSNRIISPNGNSSFSGMTFKGDKGWITSSNLPEIYFTGDGGASFERIGLAGMMFNDISMRTEYEGYAAASDSAAYKTENGGYSWSRHCSKTDIRRSVSFRSADHNAFGVCVGDNGTLAHLIPDYGWHILISFGFSSGLSGADCPEGNVAWISGDIHLFRYHSGKVYWDQTYPTGHYNAIYMHNNLKGWCVGNDGIIIRTANGTEWTSCDNPDLEERNLYAVFSLDGHLVWAVGERGLILHSPDGGMNWSVEADGLTENDLTTVFFTSAGHGFAAGRDNTLLHFGQPTFIGCLPPDTRPGIYPNPTAGKFAITGLTWNADRVEVTDIYGKVLETRDTKPGTQNPEFDISRLPEGIYLVRIRIDNRWMVKKIIKI